MSKKQSARWRATSLVSLSFLLVLVLAAGARGASETPGDTFAASLSAAGVFPELGVGQQVTISGEGRYVAFLSESQDLDPEAPDLRQAYVKDLKTGALGLVSRADGPAGEPANEPREGGSHGVERPFISGSGRYIAFETPADNLVPDFPPHTEFPVHVYRRDLQTGETTLIDRVSGPGGEILPIEGRLQSISPNGRYVVFTDEAENLDDPTAEHEPGEAIVYVRDVQEGTTTIVSRASGASGQLADARSSSGVISADDSYVAFASRASNLVPGMGSNTVSQIYLRGLQPPYETILVSQSEGGVAADESSFEPFFAGDDDCRVAFSSLATNLDGADPPVLGVYLRDLCAAPASTTLISLDEEGEPFEEAFSAGATGDGAIAFEGTNPFPSTRHLYLRDPGTGQIALLDRAPGAEGEPSEREVEWGAISANGCRAAFTTAASNLTPESEEPPAGKRQAYVRQLSKCEPSPKAPSDAPPSGAGSHGKGGVGPVGSPPIRLKIVGLGRRKLVLEFSGPGIASVKIKRLLARLRPHWKGVAKFAVQATQAGRVGAELPQLPSGRYRIGVHLRESHARPLVRLLTIG